MDRRTRTQAAGALALSCALLGCPGEPPSGTNPGDETPAAGTTPEPGVATEAPAEPFLARGQVVETMNAGGYTYVCLDAGGPLVWAAGPQTEVSVGDAVELPAGMPMQSFSSSVLGRTFELIYFVERLVVLRHAGSAQLLTVGELLARREELAGEVVAVRGRVTRVTEHVLGKTWIHIQDEEARDLVITTPAPVAMGGTVLVEGVLRLDRDFGSGYRFATMIEDASVGEVPAGHPVGRAAIPPAGGVPFPPASPAPVGSPSAAGGTPIQPGAAPVPPRAEDAPTPPPGEAQPAPR